MHDNSPSDRSEGDDGEAALAVLTAMRAMSRAALAGDDDLKSDDDEDVVAALLGGLSALPHAARVLRLSSTDQVGGLAGAQAREAVQAIRAAAITPATATGEPLLERSTDGRVSRLIAPLVGRSGELEIFVIETDSHRSGLTALECAAAAALRDHALLALSLRESRAQSRLDSLTGCLNHGAMLAQLDEEIARARRLSGRLACMMLDLDDFKAINDHHGHLAGDDILRAVSEAIGHQCRPYDIRCRYGGDEFLVILPEAGIEEALHSSERMRSEVARSVIVRDGVEIAVGATVGVAEWRNGESATDLLMRVDRALLRGKGAGRGDAERC